MSAPEVVQIAAPFTWWGMVVAVRPVLDRRARRLIEGHESPPSSMHRVYIALEAVKVVLLPLLGIACALNVG